MNYSVIVLAAGQGKRMECGYNKQLIKLAGTPLIVHSLRAFHDDPRCAEIVLVVSEPEKREMEALVKEYAIQRVTRIVIGGVERQNSVYAGLQQVSAAEIILIHDGARPFVRKRVVHALADAAREHGAAIAAVQVKDTVKEVEQMTIQKTVDRSKLWAAQTPQAFQKDLICKAHEEAASEKIIGTDDASLVERQGKLVAIVQSDYTNIKLTTQEDVLFAEAILQQRS
ncbi:2-C-methyl-D-erythritol 4-phosphate cytidylyltransferase [Shouchella shacheensis]|uniref:2-C-methyl-D-erythritol 4-phosphate cytidylyltransferase n=1 Tax=Shouchella shacheensis TaxID=1649580 RepID=UPI00073FE15B|nr:2-C-methyl-D-erythritol 4-phosphate cytidylyltransferase [Shouchella shacheensis]